MPSSTEDENQEIRRAHLWIDNDACPRRIREIVIKAGVRCGLPVKLVANSYMRILAEKGAHIEMICVDQGADVADDYIAEHARANDIVITEDVPLADRIVGLGAIAISPRGRVFDRNSIKEHLAMRNLRQELRDTSQIKGGPGALSDVQVRGFASSFDKALSKLLLRKK